MYGFYYHAGKSWEDKKLWEATKDNQQEDINVESFLQQDKIWNPRFNLGWDESSLLSMNHEGFTTIAKYFYELGLKTKENKL